MRLSNCPIETVSGQSTNSALGGTQASKQMGAAPIHAARDPLVSFALFAASFTPTGISPMQKRFGHLFLLLSARGAWGGRQGGYGPAVADRGSEDSCSCRAICFPVAWMFYVFPARALEFSGSRVGTRITHLSSAMRS